MAEQPGAASPAPSPLTATLRLTLDAYPDSLEPQKAFFVNEIAHLQLFYEGLTTFDETLATVPGGPW